MLWYVREDLAWGGKGLVMVRERGEAKVLLWFVREDLAWGGKGLVMVREKGRQRSCYGT